MVLLVQPEEGVWVSKFCEFPFAPLPASTGFSVSTVKSQIPCIYLLGQEIL